jgi:hypothetical protein
MGIISTTDALSASEPFHDEPPSLHENLEKHDPVYRGLLKFTSTLIGSLYIVIVAGTFITVMGPLTLLGGILVNLAYYTPELAYRYDPCLEIWGQHMANRLAEPAILVSPRLNDLFSHFDKKTMHRLQLRWFKHEMQRFSEYVEELDKDDNALLAMSSKQHREMIILCEFLKTVPDQIDLVPEAMQRIKEWIDIHSESVQSH